jgi:gag-pre-integrase-like protein
MKVDQNLYKFPFEGADNSSKYAYAMTNQPSQSWETWHKCFGHMGYIGLKILYNRNMVKGFNVDTSSEIKSCTACIQAKLSIQPYKGHHIPCANKGEIMHIDLWGKYDVTSIRGNQYYLLLIDDATRYVTLKFLKAKLDAA